MLTVLLTGAQGFTGRYVKNKLESLNFTVKILQGDLLNKDQVLQQVMNAQPDWVIHLAAISSVAYADQEAFYKVNVFGTLNLLQSLTKLKKSPQKVLIASSANVYGMSTEEVIDENVCPKPVNHYACSKLSMEHLTRTYFAKLPIIITRPFNYTGPGQKPVFLIPKLVEHFVQGKSSLELGTLDISRDFSDVRDVVDSYIALLQSSAHGIVVNVCSGIEVSLTYIIHSLEVLAGYSIKISTQPDLVRDNDIIRLCGSNERLKSIIPCHGFRPIEDTLQEMYLEGAKQLN
jgi:nucleoside-diphosphate-sugar epimerase